jgi:BsuBI/PstI restriction endonuclease domain/BsuBI/PstI restriction endonuclease HTH domain
MADQSILDLDDTGEHGRKLQEAQRILESLGFAPPQRNRRSALILLALLDMQADKSWRDAHNPLRGVTPIMDWCRDHYGTTYAPNSRETFRRQTLHQFREAALVVLNPDNPKRETNSKDNVYQVETHALALLRTFGTEEWDAQLDSYKRERPGLQARYAKAREMEMIPLAVGEEQEITLTPGKHNTLIKAIIEEFGGRYAPGGKVLYVGDTGDKWGYFDIDALTGLEVTVDSHGKMPDVIIYDQVRNWLVLVEAVTSHGPVDGKRHDELARLFRGSTAGLVYVTAFPTRREMARYLSEISWETEVWVAEAPDHLIHFNGPRYLGPYVKA